PPLKTALAPAKKVCSSRPESDSAIHGRTSAEHLAANDMDRMANVAGLTQVSPIVVRIPADQIRISQDYCELPRLIGRPSFQQQDVTIPVLAESCSQHRPCGAAANNYYVLLHRFAPAAAPLGDLQAFPNTARALRPSRGLRVEEDVERGDLIVSDDDHIHPGVAGRFAAGTGPPRQATGVVQCLRSAVRRVGEVGMRGAQVARELVQGIVPDEDARRRVQHTIVGVEFLDGSATASCVPLAKDLLKVSVQQFMNSVVIHNENAEPLVWVKTGDQILASIRPLCQRISETGH